METFIFLLIVYVCLGIGGGVIVFGLYHLLYKRTIKKNGVIASSSLVVRIAFVMGCVNTLLGILLCLQFYLEKMVGPLSNNIPKPIGYLLEPILLLIASPILMVVVCYSILTIPISLASIAVSFIERKKKLITGKRFVTVVLINISGFALLILFFYAVTYKNPKFW